MPISQQQNVLNPSTPISNLVAVAVILDGLPNLVTGGGELYATLEVTNAETGEIEQRKVLF